MLVDEGTNQRVDFRCAFARLHDQSKERHADLMDARIANSLARLKRGARTG
jgi:hypothetical protein